jgi:ribonuclease PH
MRHDGRKSNQMRKVVFHRHFTAQAGGAVLVECGATRVLCTAMIEPGVPAWLQGKGRGWLTAEYAMLPSATPNRKKRDGARPDGRSVEIQRLVGRALRRVVNLVELKENTLWLDCDVLQADGGTRTAAITGAYVALCDAVRRARRENLLANNPITGQVAALSVGLLHGRAILDLDYQEDSAAQVDMNVAMLADGSFVEVQATGEQATFTTRQLAAMLRLAATGIRRLHALQNKALRIK